MEYPHYQRRRREVDEDVRRGFQFKPKVVVYALVCVLATLHYFLTVPGFTYIALAFLGYALYKLVTCGCWKSQLRTLAALGFVAIAYGASWRPLLSIAIALVAFEMFL